MIGLRKKNILSAVVSVMATSLSFAAHAQTSAPIITGAPQAYTYQPPSASHNNSSISSLPPSLQTTNYYGVPKEDQAPSMAYEPGYDPTVSENAQPVSPPVQSAIAPSVSVPPAVPASAVVATNNYDPPNLPAPSYQPASPPDNQHPVYVPPQTNKEVGVGTLPGLSVGLQGSYYQYQEPGFGPRLEGLKGGITADATGLVLGKIPFTGQFRYAFGPSNYKGSGTSANNMENLFEVRGLVGRDFKAEDFGITPFIGVGYRHLESNDRGTTTTGLSGYMRDNALFYAPIGVTPRMKLGSDLRMSATLEGDLVFGGTQTSYLSDVDPSYPNITNHQSAGYGIRGNLMFEGQSWSVGPFFDYWNIGQSDTQCGRIAGTSNAICGYEPRNTTVEAGFQFSYRFFHF